jgi:hypothetical protein
MIHPIALQDAELDPQNPAGPILYQGTNFPIRANVFRRKTDSAKQDRLSFKHRFLDYGGGDVKVSLAWTASVGNSGNLVMGATMAAVSPGDGVRLKAKAPATEIIGTVAYVASATEFVLNTLDIVLTGSALDGLAQGDLAWITLRRDVSCNIMGNVLLLDATISYTSV